MKRKLTRMAALAIALCMAIIPALAEEDDIVIDPSEELPFEDSLITEKKALASDMKNLLLIGIDARPGEETGRSDTMIIVTIDPDANIIRLTSIMRDLYVEIPGRKNNRINAAYVFGGAELLMQTIEQNFGIHIDNYIAVNFSMLGALIDSIGGLTLNVESEYFMNRINAVIKMDNKVLGIDISDQLLKEPGEQLMTGKQAQAYARYRYGTSDGDFGRTARQREVITKIFDKLCKKTAIELMSLTVENIGNIYTNLSISELAGFAPVMLSMNEADIRQLRLPIDKGYTNRTVSGMSVLVPDREKNVQALEEFLED